MAESGTSGALTAPYRLEYTFSRSTGPVVERFLLGLRSQRIEGIRMRDGGVLVPPLECDPKTGDELSEFVEVGQSGEVTAWSWVAEPLPEHPVDRPFAWALIKLDGADTAMLHVVDVPDESAMTTGMRVTAEWRDERKGFITDIACFRPETA